VNTDKEEVEEEEVQGWDKKFRRGQPFDVFKSWEKLDN